MDSQDHKITATSAEHEGHGVHLCHRCGWPFPNPHPSAKHRRAHKRVCGTIEGYKVIHSEEHGHDLADSDDEHASDEDVHTPSPNLAKKNAESSGRVGEKSNKSEDDVFSDAVTDFSESGISPRLEERLESVRELDKSMEQKGVEGDLYGSGSLKVDETAERTEQSNDPPKTEEVSIPGPLVNGNNQSGSVIPITDTSAEPDSVRLINGSQPEHGVGGSPQGELKSAQDADIQVQEKDIASVTLDSEEGKISDRTLTAVERREELCDEMESEVVKHELLPQTETLANLDAPDEVDIVAHSAKISTSTKTVEVTIADETYEKTDASVGVKEVSYSTEEMPIGAVGENTSPQESRSSTHSVKPDERTPTLDAVEHSDGAPIVSSTDKEVKPETSLAGGENASSFNASEGEKCDMNGNENQNLESMESFSVDTVSPPDSADKTFAPEDDRTARAFKEDVDHCEEKTKTKLLETGNEKGEGASVEEQVILDSKIPSDDSMDFPSSYEVDSNARNLEELSKNNSSSPEPRYHGFEKSIQGHGTDEVTEVLQSVGSVGGDAEINHDIGDVLDKSSPQTASLEGPVSPVISELPHNIHWTQNVVGVKSADVAETVSEVKDNNEVVASEKTPEQSISKESTSLCTDSGLLSENSANDNGCVREGTKASGSIDTTEMTAKVDHEDNVSEVPMPSVQEASPTSKILDVTSSGVEERHSSKDFSALKSVGIVSTAELDGNVLASDKCSVTPNVKEPLPSPLDLHETSATGDDKTVVNVEDSKSLQAEVDDKLTKEDDGVSTINLSGSSISRSDSLEGHCGSVVSDTIETNSQKHKSMSEEARCDKSDTFEPPSFMTLVQSGSEGDQVSAATEIETVQKNQQPKSDALQAGWFPSITNVVNESEGRKKNEEIIAKVTNWSPVKQQHGPLKSLLNEVKSPNTKQVPAAANQRVETEHKDNNAGVTTVGSVLLPEAPATKDQNTSKDAEEWNSPARYPIEIKKEKKKKARSYWVPFVCCSSVHRDL